MSRCEPGAFTWLVAVVDWSPIRVIRGQRQLHLIYIVIPVRRGNQQHACHTKSGNGKRLVNVVWLRVGIAWISLDSWRGVTPKPGTPGLKQTSLVPQQNAIMNGLFLASNGVRSCNSEGIHLTGYDPRVSRPLTRRARSHHVGQQPYLRSACGSWRSTTSDDWHCNAGTHLRRVN